MTGGAIRSRGRRGATIVPNWRWEDPDLDPYDLRIAGWLASHADSYRDRWVTRNEVARRTGISGPKVSSSLTKLAALGIVTVEAEPHTAGGRNRWVITFDFEVWEAPNVDQEADPPPPGRPLDESRDGRRPREPRSRSQGSHAPDQGSHAPATRGHQVEEQLEVLPSVPSGAGAAVAARTATRPEDDPDFLTFWEMYGRVGPRSKAWDCWRKAVRSGAEPAAIIAGLERWVTYWRQPGAARVKWPQGWLNERRWEDDPPVVLLAAQRPAAATGRQRALDHLRNLAGGTR